jgi:pilus assembly protein CpaB
MIDVQPRTLALAASALFLAGGALLMRSISGLALPEMPPAVEIARPAPAEETPLVQVVVALREIPRGAVVDPTALATIGMATLPPGDVAREARDLAGHVALERIAAGQTVPRAAVSASPTAAGLGPLVPPGMRAVTLRLAEDTGISYLVRPGDRVDVVLATRDDIDQPNAAGSTRPDIARVMLQDVQVLAIGEQLGAEPLPAAQQRPGPLLRNATVALPPEQLPLLALARGDGGYALALRNPGDRDQPVIVRADRAQLIGAETPAPPAPAPATAMPSAPLPRPAPRSGPEMILGPMRSTR